MNKNIEKSTIWTWPLRLRIIIAFATITADLVFIYFSFPVIGNSAFMSLFLPAVVLGLFLDYKYSTAVMAAYSLFIGLANVIFFSPSGDFLWPFVFGSLMSIVVTWVVGYLRKLQLDLLKENHIRKNLQKEIIEKRQKDKEITKRLRREIKERAIIENKIEESREKYKALIDLAGVAIITDDAEGNIKYYNQYFAKLFGYDYQDIAGKSIWNYIYQGDLEKIKSYHNSRKDGKSAPRQYEFRGLRSDKIIIYLEIYTEGIYNSDGQFEGTSSYIWDVTERIVSQQILKESEERFRGIFENATLGIYRTTMDGQILMANSALVELLEFPTLNALYDYNVKLDKASRNLRNDNFLAQLEENGLVKGLEEKWITFKGNEITVHETAWTINDRNGNIMYIDGIVEDVTLRKKAEEEREKLIADLQKALVEIKTLSGLLPICSSCKKIRDDSGYWYQIEEYIGSHSGTQFSHGICPDCAEKLYPEYLDD